MNDTGMITALVFVVAACTPILTIYKPDTFGPVGVVLLTLGGVVSLVMGGTAFTETTAAILLTGAFCLAVLVAIYKLMAERR